MSADGESKIELKAKADASEIKDLRKEIQGLKEDLVEMAAAAAAAAAAAGGMRGGFGTSAGGVNEGMPPAPPAAAGRGTDYLGGDPGSLGEMDGSPRPPPPPRPPGCPRIVWPGETSPEQGEAPIETPQAPRPHRPQSAESARATREYWERFDRAGGAMEESPAEDEARRNSMPPPPPPPLSREFIERLEGIDSEAGAAFVNAPRAWMEENQESYQGLEPKQKRMAYRYMRHMEKHYPEGAPDEYEPDIEGREESEESSSGGPSRDPDAERRHKEMMRAVKSGAGTARGLMMGGIGLGLGSGIFGFMTASAEWWIQTSKALSELEQKLGSVASRAIETGHAMGYTAQESFAAFEAIGAQTDTVSDRQFRQTTGFARITGQSPDLIASTVGRMTMLSSGRMFGPSGKQYEALQNILLTKGPKAYQAAIDRIEDESIMSLRGEAAYTGMGHGRQAEFYQAYTGMAEDMLGKAGYVTRAGVSYAQTLIPSMVFGRGDPRAQGEMASRFAQNLNSMVSGQSSQAMKVFMMRALNFGREGGQGYMQTVLQMERGMFDPKNLAAMSKRLRAGLEGAGVPQEALQENMFRILQGDAMSSGMSMSSLAAVSGMMSDPRRAMKLEMLAQNADNQELQQQFLNELPESDRADFAKRGGIIGMAQAKIPEGARRQTQQIEPWYQKTGPTMLKAIMDMGSVTENLGKILNQVSKALFGQGVLDDIKSVSTTLLHISEFMESHFPKGGTLPDAVKNALEMSAAQNINVAAQVSASPIMGAGIPTPIRFAIIGLNELLSLAPGGITKISPGEIEDNSKAFGGISHR